MAAIVDNQAFHFRRLASRCIFDGMAYLTEAELIAYAAPKGAKVTPDKLKRWRAAKLLPPTVRRGRGRLAVSRRSTRLSWPVGG